MRVTLALLLLCIPAAGFAEGFGDGILRKDWLPAPDHFQWPVLAEKKPKQRQKTRTLKELSESRRAIFRHYWPEDQLPKEFRFTITDLNADGLEEIFLPIPAYSGPGGTFYQIFPLEGISNTEIWARFKARSTIFDEKMDGINWKEKAEEGEGAPFGF